MRLGVDRLAVPALVEGHGEGEADVGEAAGIAVVQRGDQLWLRRAKAHTYFFTGLAADGGDRVFAGQR
ncbi:hypothetical protein O7632_04215 [Solwaraspora sp. WMMD406]|uniref:hypothetical protein n=1 Tax=Solwaraspora sp. WMMD406 TaxID=3016095 RepID=UPI0024180058|nr:hypothetical protein [Solwaraspora sp. WMMD406]MDG4763316.1 hypothetical protein [Solwaraspora sp. WMMD406]